MSAFCLRRWLRAHDLARRMTAVVGLVATLAACGPSAADRPAHAGAAATRPARTSSSAIPPVHAGSAAASPPPRAVLVLTQTRGYHHASIPWAVAALRRLAAHNGRMRLVFLPTAAALTPARLQHASAVVFLLTSGELPLSRLEKRALVAYVRRGGGLAGFHSATDTFHRWPAYLAMIGAEFSHHPLPSTQQLVVEDGTTPMTRTLPRSFAIHEEFYVFKHDPRPRAHILVRLATRHDQPDRPLVWCRRSGRGRVFYDALGHFPQTWSDARQLALVAGGIAWATGLMPARAC